MARDSSSRQGGVGNTRTIDNMRAGFEKGQAGPEQIGASGSVGARVHHRYHDRTEDTIAVTRDDLREIKAVGWIQQSFSTLGTFFFSGAFWLLFELMAHQEKFEFTAWMGMCVVSIIAGGALASAGWIMFALKQKRLNKYFDGDAKQGAVTWQQTG